MLTTRECSERLNVSPATIRRYIRKGALTPVRLPGGAFRISEDELQRFLHDYSEGPDA